MERLSKEKCHKERWKVKELTFQRDILGILILAHNNINNSF